MRTVDLDEVLDAMMASNGEQQTHWKKMDESPGVRERPTSIYARLSLPT
jgi:hypothetical protein